MSDISKIDELIKRLDAIEKRLDGSIYPADKCPNCGGDDVKFELAKDNRVVNPQTGTHVSQKFTCNSCGADWKVIRQLV